MDSIIAQTYKHLEILVIDDGSTDTSGEICDEYAQRDSRIRVIHQENQGLAEVRNIGIRECMGEWVQFVDSDDWIDPETIETCYRYALEYDAEIVCFRFVKDHEDGRSYHDCRKSNKPLLMDSAEAVSLFFFHAYMGPATCSKLIKTDLHRGIEYPRGKLWEDTYTVYKVLARAKCILSINSEFYHYFVRLSSIAHREFSPENYEHGEAAQGCLDFAEERFTLDNEQRRNLRLGVWRWKLAVVQSLAMAGKDDPEYISRLRKEINLSDIIMCKRAPGLMKIMLAIFKLSPSLFKIFYLRFRRDKS